MVCCSSVCNPRFIQFNIMKVYIERNNIQVELMRFRKKYRLYSHLRLRGDRVPEPLYVYSILARWQQLATIKLITIHSPDGSTPRYAHQNGFILTVLTNSQPRVNAFG